ncbi:Gamma-interferon-inducible lysosomal thiol reductase 1 [Carabus blaptoides fortunei]
MNSYHIVLVILLSTCVALSIQDELKVSVYYESLCPDSVRFIKEQLTPTYKSLKSIFTADLIPYGKAIQNQENGKWVFQCQHGARECYGNKMQACALQQDVGDEKKIAFVDCVMRQNDPSQPASGGKCASNVGLAWESIRACTNSAAGDDILAAMGDRTHAVEPQISFVPTVIFNSTYDDDLQWKAIKNLRQVICNLQGNPDICG